MPGPATSVTEPGLLFVPDISGFTQFVKSTEVEHSRHIITELLEKLIESNDIGLKVSEIEGDAILFYRFGPPPTPEEFFQQVEKMFVAYHGQLRLYETQRICNCGACSLWHDLTLKIVAHYGEICESEIQDHRKLFGQEVIAVHRLLKNDIPHHEYALFTQALEDEWPEGSAPEWAQREDGVQEYDVGTINFGHVPLKPLRELVPEPKVEDYSIPGVSVPVFSSERMVNAPMEMVFNVTIDLPARLHWMLGAKDVKLLNDQIDRVGTRHRCVVDENSPVMVTNSSTRGEDIITLSETDEKRTMCSVYTFQREGDAQTRLRIDGFLKNNLVLRIMFTLLLKKKLSQWFVASGDRLKEYCEELYSTQEPH
jgi:hypothetical protein